MKKYFVGGLIFILGVTSIRIYDSLVFSHYVPMENFTDHQEDSLHSQIDYIQVGDDEQNPLTKMHCQDVVVPSSLDIVPRPICVADNNLKECEKTISTIDFCNNGIIKENDIVANNSLDILSIIDSSNTEKDINKVGIKNNVVIEKVQDDVVKLIDTPQLISQVELRANNILNSFSQRSDFGEVGMQAILNLIEAELVLVGCLLNGSSGYTVERAAYKISRKRAKSMLSVVRAYDMVLDVATFNAHTESLLQRYIVSHSHKTLHKALGRDQKRLFLKHMNKTLFYYRDFVHDLQKKLSYQHF